MKTKLTLLLVVLLPLAVRAADDLSTALQKGLFEEEANQNLPAAIKAYESLLAASDEQRKLAATALFRLGECYRKLGKTNDAVAQYQRLLRDYADQTTLATLSRQNLVGLGSVPAPTTARTSDGSRAGSVVATELARTEGILAQLKGWDLPQLRRLIPQLIPDTEFDLLDKELAGFEGAERRVELGGGGKLNFSPEDEKKLALLRQRVAQRSEEMLRMLEVRAETLRAQLAAERAESATPQPTAAGTAGSAPTDEEEKEIRRIQALIKDSPDLINAVNVEVTKVRSGELMEPKNGALLHKAASLGQLAVAGFLLEHGASVTIRDEVGKAPLHWAAGNGHKAMVELLLANGADVNPRMPGRVMRGVSAGETPLYLAVDRGFRSVCETLLERGADPNLGNSYGNPPVVLMVRRGDEAMLRLLLAKGAKVNPDLDKKIHTPLHDATATNIARILIESGAIVDATNSDDRSPLHLRASEGNREVLELLLAAGANPNLKGKEGKTPLHLAAASWKANVVAPLIAKGANPNERDSVGGTPLDALIRFGDGNRQNSSFAPQIEALQALLAGGADPNLTQRGGSPHLHRAVVEGLEEQAEMLLKAGADPNTKYAYSDGNGWQTPLTAALQGTKRPERAGEKNRSMELVKLLLDYKADPNLSNGAGASPLWFAMVHGSRNFAERAPFVEVLLQRGANIEGRDSDGKTPLAVAVELGMKEMTEMLLKHKADPNAKIGNGKSPLHLAASSRNMELVDILLAAGANANAVDSQGLSPLDYVKANSSTPQPGGFRLPLPPSLAPPPYIPGQQSSQRKETSPSELAERLRKAGARDWAPRPGLITVTRRSTGASQVIFSKGTNDWNRHSLLELIAFTYFGSGTQFPFPDFSRLMITRRDPASGAVKEFKIDLTAKLAADGCQADEWLEWGDLVEIPEGVHRLDEKWSGLPSAEAENFEKCVARKVTLKAGAMSKELELMAGRNWSSLVNNGVQRYQREHPPRLRDVVLKSGLLLTSSDLSRTKVTRRDAAGARRDWTFDLTLSIPEEQDLWLRDGDVIEVPEK